MGLIFDGSPVNLEAITAKVPTPTYSGKGNPGDPEATNPYTMEGPEVIGDPYWDDVVFLLQANDKNINQQVTVESSTSAKAVFNASSLVALETSPISDRAFQFNGVNQFMTIDHSADTAFAAGEDYTIEFWIKQTGAGSRRAMSIGDFNGNSGALFLYNTVPSTAAVQIVPGSTSIQDWSIAGGAVGSAWQHFALTNESNTRTIWVNGVSVGSVVNNDDGPQVQGTTSYVYFGCGDHHGTSNDGQRNYWEGIAGFMDDIRITKGVARYTDTFDVPTEPFDAF